MSHLDVGPVLTQLAALRVEVLRLADTPGLDDTQRGDLQEAIANGLDYAASVIRDAHYPEGAHPTLDDEEAANQTLADLHERFQRREERRRRN